MLWQFQVNWEGTQPYIHMSQTPLPSTLLLATLIPASLKAQGHLQPPAFQFFKKESPTKRQFTFVAVPFDRRKGYIFKKHPSQHEFIST